MELKATSSICRGEGNNLTSITAFALDGDSNVVVAGVGGAPGSLARKHRRNARAADSSGSTSTIFFFPHYNPNITTGVDITHSIRSVAAS